MRRFITTWFCLIVMTHTLSAHAAMQEVKVQASLDIARVPAGFPVGFYLLTHGRRQYVAYYDSQRNMTVASRTVDSDKWQYQILPSKVKWDSHNYITMAIDDDGYLHLSGNMHCIPLIYFRTSKPWDITTFERVTSMTGQNEKRCTYPKFMRDADNRLLFHYRDGGSGNGNEIYNVYDLKAKTWKRLLNKPLTDGKGMMNAYMSGPTRGPDGLFHLAWVWRDTSDCQTNHDPSYAQSRDLIQWQTIDGKQIDLPITIETEGTLIDPVPAKGGIINGALKIGFDSANRPVASYHKFDDKGKTQAYVARFENGHWVRRQISQWDYRWEFKGGGAIVFEIRLSAIRTYGKGKLALSYSHVKYGSGLLVIDENTLELLSTEKQAPTHPAILSKPESDFPSMIVKWAGDAGKSDSPSYRYVLRWETLPQNRDRRREGPLPEPSMLRLYKISSEK